MTVTAIQMGRESRGVDSLAAALRNLQADGVTYAAISAATSVSRTAISQLANQMVAPSIQTMDKLWSFIDRQADDDKVDMLPPEGLYKQALEIFPTEEYGMACGWCDYIRTKRKMGVLIGSPGSGKTTILRHVVNTAPGKVIYIEAMPNMRVNDLLGVISGGIGISLTGNSYRRVNQLIDAMRVRTDVMLLVDEAEYLHKWDVDKFEYLRKIWDNSGTPIILAGTPELEKLLTKGTGNGNLAQLYRRKYELQLKGISVKGAKEILRHYNISPEAVEILSKIGADAGHGGLGNLVEILDLCLETAAGGQITAEMVNDAKHYKLMY